MTSYPALSTDTETDVVVIGGGITGIMSAYLLASAGKKVVVLEKNTLASGATECTTAFLTQVIDTDFSDLISIWGTEKASRIAASHQSAIDLIEDIITREHIDCNFKRCHDYIYTNTPKQFESLSEEFEAAREIGVDAHLKPHKLRGFTNFGAIEIKNQAKCEPLKFIEALAQAAVKKGVRIFEHTEVEDLNESPLSVTTKNKQTVKGEWIVSATYNPFGEPAGLFLKKGMYVSYILEAQIPKGIIEEGIYEDVENPYHYFRIDAFEAYDRLIVGGEDHRADLHFDPKKSLALLKDYCAKTFSQLPFDVHNTWDGPILEPSDGLAFIGPYKNPQVLYAFGFSGNGMTYSGIAATIIRDHVLSRPNDFRDLYRTDRLLKPKPLLYKARDYSGELVNRATSQTTKKPHQS